MVLALFAFSIGGVDCLGKEKLEKKSFVRAAGRASHEVFEVWKPFVPSPLKVKVSFPTEECGKTALVKWDTQMDQQILVFSYMVRCTSQTDNAEVWVAGSQTFAKVGPLEADLEYVCTVTGRSSVSFVTKGESEPFSTM